MLERKKRCRAFESLSSVLEGYFTSIDGNQDGQISTGLVELDRCTLGLSSGHLVVIGSRPEVGKTSFALSVGEHAALQQGRSVGIFSIQSSNRDVASRILAAESLVPVRNILSGRLSARQHQAVLETNRRLENAPIFIDAVHQLDIEHLIHEAYQARDDGHLDLLIVDNVQMLQNLSHPRENRAEEFDSTVRSLKHLARELEIPVIVVSQVSSKRRLLIPTVDDLEGAAPLTEHADLILLVHRSEASYDRLNESAGIAEIIVAKNRQGMRGVFRAAFLEDVPAFRDLVA